MSEPKSLLAVYCRVICWSACLVLLLVGWSLTACWADEQPPAAKQAAEKPIPLNPQQTVLLDRKGNRVLLRAEVVLREGLLEMFCCLKRTKEHESILAVDAKAYVIHTGLVALGAEPGTPVRFHPKFQQGTGQRIDVFVSWRDEQQQSHRVRAQSWVQTATRRFYVIEMEKLPADVGEISRREKLHFDAQNRELSWYGPMSEQQRDEWLAKSADKKFREAIGKFYEESQPKEMQAHWIFTGSGFYEDPDNGQKHYMAEGGDVICVANFPTAMLDLDIRSTASGEANLLYEANAEKVPPLGTKVTIELIPVKETPEKSSKVNQK